MNESINNDYEEVGYDHECGIHLSSQRLLRNKETYINDDKFQELISTFIQYANQSMNEYD
jgi:hypothetical protein